MLAALSLLLATAAVSPAPAAESVRPLLEIRIQAEPGVALDASDFSAIASEIRRIWGPVLELAIATPSDPPRLRAIDSLPLIVTNRTLDTRENTGLGWIGFVDGEPRPEITVSLTAAQRMLMGGAWRGVAFSTLPRRAARMFVQRALARAAAHEIGHYLLRSRAHTPRGLMRAVFTVDEIMDTRAVLTRLTPADAARLRAGTGLARRSPDARVGSGGVDVEPTSDF